MPAASTAACTSGVSKCAALSYFSAALRLAMSERSLSFTSTAQVPVALSAISRKWPFTPSAASCFFSVAPNSSWPMEPM